VNVNREPVMTPGALSWGYRIVWGLCAGVYLAVFVSGIQAGGSDLGTLGRSVGFTLAMAFVGKLVLSVLGEATQPAALPPSASEVRTVGSLVDLLASPKVNELEDAAEAAEPSTGR
jgi:hypothetical protein